VRFPPSIVLWTRLGISLVRAEARRGWFVASFWVEERMASRQAFQLGHCLAP
jgi:hypothetical protein